ncbi:MAG: hypothetical protein HUJ86_00165, partial [Synergistes sp.]|nr:hypothetical protein [Synergistes sp.]
ADVEKMIDHPFNFTATPALIAPVEYTMTVEKYAEIKGHVHAMRTKEDVLKEGRHEFVELKN